jgi:hypothetical protein
VAKKSSAFGEGCWRGTAAARRRLAFWNASWEETSTPMFWPHPSGVQLKVSKFVQLGKKRR